MNSETHQHNVLKGYNLLLYFAGTMLMYDPSHECINDFWKQGILKGLPVSSKNPVFIKAASQLQQSVKDNNSTIEKMASDYSHLFGIKNMPNLLPLESRYNGQNSSEKISKKEEVSDFYSSYGWKSKFENNLPVDHIGVELLFLTLLIEKYIELDDEPCRTEMRKEIRRYIRTHLLSWIPKWNEEIQIKANTLSYKGIGTLVQACIEDIYSLMGPDLSSLN